jgi:hypothetical protein
MANSDQITAHVQKDPNPRQAEYDIFIKSRYFVAQRPAAPEVTVTTDGYFRGRVVVPGPKADRRFSYIVNANDFELMTQQLYIRFTNSNTTDGADDIVRAALHTVMTDGEADEYEAALCAQYPKRCINNDHTDKPQ